MRLAAVFSAVLILVSPATAQQQPASPGELRFTSASIEPGTPLGEFSFAGDEVIPFIRDYRVGPGDRFEANTTLRRLIAYAFGVERRWDAMRGSDPVLDELVHVSADGAAGSFDAVTPDELAPVRHMLQQLLTDRFKLTVSTIEETRQAMVLRRASSSRFGPKLRRVVGGCAEGSQAEADARGLARCVWNQQGSQFKVIVKDFEQVTTWISGTGRLDVINETGLIGAFAFETNFDPYTINLMPPALPPVDLSKPESAQARVIARELEGRSRYVNAPSFETAMKNDLDLVISYEPRPIPVLTITHVEPLREN